MADPKPPKSQASEEEPEDFFARALKETKTASPEERAGLMQIPQKYREKMIEKVRNAWANSDLFLKVLNLVLPVPKGPFTDYEFPANNKSLIKYWNLSDIVARIEWENFTWKRLSQSFTHMKVFDNIEPGDIKQGSLGDCYFLSTLSALAENPDRIKRLFITQNTTPNCQYKVSMMDLGHWKEYVIDDFFPMKSETELAFSSPMIEKGVLEMWVLLLEKAWAKKYGSYYDIQTGLTEESLTDLTGAPCRVVGRQFPDWWDQIQAADQGNHIITAGCVGTGVAAEDAEKYRSLGLVIDHAYAVIAAKELIVNGQVVRLLNVRNPWGRFEWSGDWSDNSPLWTPQAKSDVGFTNAPDGTFWISFSDFQKYFESTTICMANDSFWTQSLAMDQTKEEEFSVVEMVVNKKTELYFMVCQIDERRFGGREGGYVYSPVRIIAARQDGSRLEYLDGKITVGSRDAWIHLSLSPGTYLIYVEFVWRSEITDLFGVSVYCQNPVDLRDVTSENGDFLERCYSLDFLAIAEVSSNLESDGFRYRSYKFSGKKPTGELQEGIYLDLFENLNPGLSLLLGIKHSPWENMVAVNVPKAESGIFTLELAPGDRKIVIKKQKQLQEKHGFKVFLKKTFVPTIRH